MISQAEGEFQVKALQKQFLCWVETHPALENLDHRRFNDIRKRLYRATFKVFRLGIIGIRPDQRDPALWAAFFGWMDQLEDLSPEVATEMREQCFWIALQVFRAGAKVEVQDEV